MKFVIILISTLVLLTGCTTTDVNTGAKPQFEQPAKLRVGMSVADVQSILGKPKTRTSSRMANGEVVETWVFRTLVREWDTIQHTDFETIQKPNLITGEMEEVVVPVESTVRRTLHQEITVKIHNDQVIGLDSKMIEDVDSAL